MGLAVAVGHLVREACGERPASAAEPLGWTRAAEVWRLSARPRGARFGGRFAHDLSIMAALYDMIL